MNNPSSYSRYNTPSKRDESLNSFYWKELLGIGCIATLIFCAMDFAFMYSKWHAAYTESTIILFLITAATAAVLDLPMMIAAMTIRRMQHGFLEKSAGVPIVILSFVAFLTAFAFNVWFSYTTKDIVFSSLGSNMTITGVGAALPSTSADDSDMILSAAMFSAMLPFGTSIASFVITLFTYDPRKMMLMKIRRARIKALDHKRHLEQSISEAQLLAGRISGSYIAYNNALMQSMIATVMTQREIRRQAFRQALMEIVGDNNAINRIIDNAEQINAQTDFPEEPYNLVPDMELSSLEAELRVAVEPTSQASASTASTASTAFTASTAPVGTVLTASGEEGSQKASESIRSVPIVTNPTEPDGTDTVQSA